MKQEINNKEIGGYIYMNIQEYKTMLENALRFHKLNEDKENIKQVEEILKRLNNKNN